MILIKIEEEIDNGVVNFTADNIDTSTENERAILCSILERLNTEDD